MRWLTLFSMFLLVAGTARAQQITPSAFIAGEWKLSCSASGLPGGVVIQGNRISSSEFGWGCVFLELTERKPHFSDYGPAWDFRARCDLASDKSAGPGSPSGVIGGNFVLNYRGGDRKRTELTMRIDKPAERGGLLSLFPHAAYGPFVRCAE